MKSPGRMTGAHLPGGQQLPSERGCFDSASARLRLRRMKHQRVAIHAVAQAGRLRAIVEDVAEMAAAAAAMHLGPRHAEGAVFGGRDGVFERLVEARPARAALEFGVGREQRKVASPSRLATEASKMRRSIMMVSVTVRPEIRVSSIDVTPLCAEYSQLNAIRRPPNRPDPRRDRREQAAHGRFAAPVDAFAAARLARPAAARPAPYPGPA